MDCVARPDCWDKSRLSAWVGKGEIGNGEFTAAAPAKDVARECI